MKTISKKEFTFIQVGYGKYQVVYTSPVTQKKWSRIINDSLLIDATRNEDNPKKSDLKILRKLVKTGFYV